MKSAVAVSVVLVSLFASASRAAADMGCTEIQDPQSLVEGLVLMESRQAYEQRRRAARAQEPALLALSDGSLRIAYAAGLLGGWSETGHRPDFSVVTAVGKSALLAPFAFVGVAADRDMARAIKCSQADDWRALADEIATLIDAVLIQKMARRHGSGARVLVALPGSAARLESVWDLGAIAAGNPVQAQSLIAEILRAGVDPGYTPRISGGVTVERNMVFRKAGSGEAFLWPRGTTVKFASMTLIHSAVFFPDESDDFVAAHGTTAPGAIATHWLLPAADFLSASRAAGANFRFASIKPMLNLQRSDATFDLIYARDLYRHAYQQGRMGSEWRTSLPTLRR